MGAYATAASSGSIGRGSAPMELLKEDMEKSANCFRLGSDGVVSEGFILSLNHPLFEVPTLILGERAFVMRDSNGRRGCLYHPTSRGALVRRAQIHTHESKSGKAIKFLQRLDREPDFILVHVEFGFRQGVRMAGDFKPFSKGILGGSRIAGDKCEALVELRKRDVLSVFYPDGNVAQARYEDFLDRSRTDLHTLCSRDDALPTRLSFIESRLKKIQEEYEGNERRKREDVIYHEVAQMIGFADRVGLRGIIQFLDFHGKEGYRGGVRKHLQEAFRSLGDTTYYPWYSDLAALHVPQTKAKVVSPETEKSVFSKKQKRQTNLARRRAADIARHEEISRRPRPGERLGFSHEK